MINPKPWVFKTYYKGEKCILSRIILEDEFREYILDVLFKNPIFGVTKDLFLIFVYRKSSWKNFYNLKLILLPSFNKFFIKVYYPLKGLCFIHILGLDWTSFCCKLFQGVNRTVFSIGTSKVD